jgi:DNA-directed RNA polymerase specialized sigma24 family protein
MCTRFCCRGCGALGVAVGTVKATLFAAKTTLREALAANDTKER